MSSDIQLLSEPNVNYMGVARWPSKVSVNPLKWIKQRIILTSLWGVAVVTSAGIGLVNPYGTAVAILLVLAGLYYWSRVWKAIWYSCLVPAVVISKQPLQIAAYANLAQTRKFFPAIRISPVSLSTSALEDCEIGRRVVCIGNFEPPLAGFKWVDFQPIPLENLISNTKVIQASLERLPEHLWEALEAGLGTISPPESGLYEIPVDLYAAAESYDVTEIDEANATTTIQRGATKKNLMVHYTLVGCIGIAILGLFVYNRMNAYGSAVQSGDSAFKSGNFASAAQHYEKAIRLDPKRPLAYYHRAVVYQKAGDHRKAQMDFNDLLKLKPDFGPGYRLRAASLKALRLDDASANDMAMADKLGADKTIADPFKITAGLE